VLACLQDLSQARARWGVAAQGFPSLFGYTLVLPGIGDVTTLRALSALAGEREELRISLSHPLGPGETGPRGLVRRLLLGPRQQQRSQPARTLTVVPRPRLPLDTLARGQHGHAVLVDPQNRFSTVRLTPWFATEPWRSLLDPPTPQAAPPTPRIPGITQEPSAAREPSAQPRPELGRS